MLVGNPLLATIDASGTVRTMELVAGAFSQITSQGGFATTTYGPPVCPMGWADDQLVIIHQSGSNRYYTLYDVLMTQLANLNQTANGSTQQWRAGYSKKAKLGLILDRTNSSITPRKVRVGTGTLTAETHAIPAIVPNLENIAISPDGSKMTGLSSDKIANILNDGIDQDLRWPNDFLLGASEGVWDKYNKYLVAGSSSDAIVEAFKFDEATETLIKIMDITNGGRSFEAVAMSDVGNLLAVGWTGDDGITTKIYRRLGDFYQEIQTLTQIGVSLDFTADGTILIDSVGQTAYRRNATTGLFEADFAMMANIAPGVVGQALSDHVPVIVSTVDYYQAGIDELTSAGSISVGDLKFTLATDAAPVYNSNHATLADVVGSAEVSTGGWPAGGVPLVNPLKTSGDLSVKYGSDDIDKVIIGSAVTFRYVILHQNGIPILRHDMNQNVSVAENDKMVIDVPLQGVLNIAA